MVIREDTSNINIEEHVDDSEPERKRIKLQAVDNKRRRKHQKQLQNHDSPLINHVVMHPRPAGGETTNLKELDGVTNETTLDDSEIVVVNITNNTKPRCSKTSPNLLLHVPLEISRPQISLAAAPQHILSSDATGTEDVPSESNIIARLGHLAYKQVRLPSDNMPDSSRAECRPPATKLQIHRNKVGSLGKEPVPDFDVTKCDVGPLLGCVSCEARWTIKKSAAHKLSHITTCARKNGINPSTLQRLVERELLKLQHAKTNDKKTKPCSDSADAVSQTYMESVVSDAQPKKKQRRTDTAGTLQPVSQTRAAILDRAKALLGAWGAVPCDAPEPEHNQAFGRSKLATGHMQVENIDPTESHLSEECALTSRLALLRSMADSHTTCPSQGASSVT